MAGSAAEMWSEKDASRLMKALEREKHLRADEDRTGRRARRGRDRDRRRDLFEGASHWELQLLVM